MKLRFLMILLTTLFILAACGTGNDQKDVNSGAEEPKQSTENKATEEVLDASSFPQLTTEVQENETLVEMETSMGMIKIKLFPELAPKTVENFVGLSKKGYYDGVSFHRVIPDFMIQGGDPDGTGRGGESIFGEAFEDEFSDRLFNLRGALSMANSGPNTNGSQFFIVQNSNISNQVNLDNYPKHIVEAYAKGGTPWLDNKHTVFGQVIEGMDVVDKIANVKTGAADKPAEDVVIKHITVKE
jgi:peptidyl-prolyl cis-trans isomerase B (cyclophilin B)